MRMVLFYSKSKDLDDLDLNIPSWRKLLSNFSPVAPRGLRVEVNGETRTYPTVEHAFQAAKYLFHAVPRDKAIAAAVDFESGRKVGDAAASAKSAGGRKGMASRGITLQTSSWNSASEKVMRELLTARFADDADFRQVLQATAMQKLTLVHFERSAAKSYWGGVRKKDDTGRDVVLGQNKLWELLMELRNKKLTP